MTLVVWVERSDGMMEPIGAAVLNKEVYEEQLVEIAESIRKENGNPYTQLWNGLECVASAGKPEFT